MSETTYELTESQVELLTRLTLRRDASCMRLINESGKVVAEGLDLPGLFINYEKGEARKAQRRLESRPRTKLTRAQAYILALELMDENMGADRIRCGGKNTWHFGRCEIQALLDGIYGFDSDGFET